MQIRELPFTELLSHIADNRGRTCPTAESGRPLIATNCISNGRLYPSYDTVRFVSDQTYRTWFRSHPLPGDIIFVCKGSPGRVALAPDPVDFCIAQDMVAVRADANKVYPRYLFAVLRSQAVQDRIGNMHVGTLIPHFKKGDFDKLNIPVPNRKEQEFVGDTYFELSAKIEQNRRAGRKLEALARAVFKAWFVDFEPVKAKAAGATAFPGMPAETFAALPTRLVDSELGPVPEGWRLGALGDICTLKRGYDLPAAKRVAGKVPIVSSSGITGTHNQSKARSPGVITGRYGTIGQVHFINSDYWPLNTTLYVEDFKGLSPRFVFHVLSRVDFLKYVDKAAVPGVNRNHLHLDSLAIAPAAVQHHFTQFVQPLWAHIERTVDESAKLGALRDYLLPRLLSGKVRVREAEKWVGLSEAQPEYSVAT